MYRLKEATKLMTGINFQSKTIWTRLDKFLTSQSSMMTNPKVPVVIESKQNREFIAQKTDNHTDSEQEKTAQIAGLKADIDALDKPDFDDKKYLQTGKQLALLAYATQHTAQRERRSTVMGNYDYNTNIGRKYSYSVHNNLTMIGDETKIPEYKEDETLFTLLNECRSVTMKNPYVLLISISKYRDRRDSYRDLDGSVKDTALMYDLWHNIYNYDNMTVLCNEEWDQGYDSGHGAYNFSGFNNNNNDDIDSSSKLITVELHCSNTISQFTIPMEHINDGDDSNPNSYNINHFYQQVKHSLYSNVNINKETKNKVEKDGNFEMQVFLYEDNDIEIETIEDLQEQMEILDSDTEDEDNQDFTDNTDHKDKQKSNRCLKLTITFTEIKRTNNINVETVESSSKILGNGTKFKNYLKNKVVSRINLDEKGNIDGLIVCFSGHGIKDKMILSNGEEFEFRSLFDIFNGDNCGHLLDKPKLFFLDCCRGKDIAESKRIWNGSDSYNSYNYGQRNLSQDSFNFSTGGSQISRHRGMMKHKRNDWIETKFHPSSGFATIYSNCDKYKSNDGSEGGCLMMSIHKVFKKPQLIEYYSLRELIVAIRRQTKIYAGGGKIFAYRGSAAVGSTAQCVDFHESLEHKVYLRKNIDHDDSENDEMIKNGNGSHNHDKNKFNCLIQ